MINTYNESLFHEKIKEIYAMKTGGKTEERLEDTQWICDIIAEDGEIIEIQTANLSALTEKARHILKSGKKLRIVHPISEIKWIELYDEDGKLIRRKKSPKKESIFDSLRGMTKICPLFLEKNLRLEVLYCETSEIRQKTESPCQNSTKSRRHLRDWISKGKRLERIIRKESFDSKSDWENLIPEKLREGFRLCELTREIKTEFGVQKAKWANLLVWILLKMEILELYAQNGRSKIYRIAQKPSA